MASLEEIREIRLAKLELLKKNGIDPYPAHVERDCSLSQLVEKFDTLSEEGKDVTVVGRIMSLRAQGGLVFFHLYDGTARFQGLLKKEEVEETVWNLFEQTVDIGDFIQISGTLFITKRGEKTVAVKNWKMASKSLRPLPEKWHGLQDPDELFRKRYLDILFNEETRDLFVKKAKFWQAIRTFLLDEGFLEVETPVIENTTGGADARPFETHHNALDIDVYMRISAGELWQKRLMVAGYPKVFEIGRVFRNEGMSPEHAQDYTQMEFYWAYTDYEKGMELVERMYKYVAQEAFGTLQFKIGEFDVDLGKSWERYDYTETIKKYTHIDISDASIENIEAKLKELNVDYDKKGWNLNRAIDTLWKYCRKQLGGPGFLINIPTFLSPLAKTHVENAATVQQFQPMIAGSELGKGYSELNDPLDQARRFQEQAALREAGDDEAQMNDHEFVEALEYGMPPTCGFGISERLFAFLANRPIRETQIFPLMRPVTDNSSLKKSKSAKVAVAILNKAASLEEWQKMNTVGHLTAAFGARTHQNLFRFNTIETADGKEIDLNIQHAIIIREADSNNDIVSILEKAQQLKLEVTEFTREMIETTNDKKVVENTKAKQFREIEFLGVLVFGEKDIVDSITSQYKLYS